jgi:DNA-binding transcriptional MerR regulator
MAEIEKVYYSLRETEQETGVPATTLRYWEKQFDELNPRKDGHGNRYYTRADQEIIKRIKYIRDELKITRIEVGMIDYLKDSPLIRIFYDDPADVGNSIARFGRMPKEM